MSSNMDIPTVDAHLFSGYIQLIRTCGKLDEASHAVDKDGVIYNLRKSLDSIQKAKNYISKSSQKNIVHTDVAEKQLSDLLSEAQNYDPRLISLFQNDRLTSFLNESPLSFITSALDRQLL